MAITLKLFEISSVEVAKCVKFQIPRYKGFKVGIFRISPIDHIIEHKLVLNVNLAKEQ